MEIVNRFSEFLATDFLPAESPRITLASRRDIAVPEDMIDIMPRLDIGDELLERIILRVARTAIVFPDHFDTD